MSVSSPKLTYKNPHSPLLRGQSGNTMPTKYGINPQPSLILDFCLDELLGARGIVEPY